MSPAPACPRCGAPAAAADSACTRCSAPTPSATLSLPGDGVPASAGSTGGGATGTGPGPATRGPSELDPPAIPTRIGRFEVRGLLGEGVFGEVYRGYDPLLDREVAVKVAKPGSLGTAQRVKRFLREAKAAANLRHPHIVPLYETGEDAGQQFLVSAFVDGRTLARVLEEAGGGLPPAEAAAVGRKLAAALAYAHGQGVVHRDVKPDNVMIDGRGEPHLLDFGLAAREEAGEEKLTQLGGVVGSPAYMSPEQARGDAGVGPAADQYSLGCTLYELLTGRTPFAGPREVQLLLHQTADPTRPRAVDPRVPRDLDTVVMKCLEKDPGRRYPDCRALADDLRRWQEGEPVTARRAGMGERFLRWARRHPSVAAGVTAAAVTLILGAVVSAFFALEAHDRAEQARREAARADGEAENARRQTALAEQAATEVRRQKVVVDGVLRSTERVAYDAQIAQADSLVRAGEFLSARKVLDATHWELRGWEYGYLRRRAEAGLAILAGHTGEVVAVTFSPDGRWAVTGSRDTTARVWDADTGRQLAVLRGHTATVSSVAFSSNGRLLLTGSADGTVRTWDVPAWRERATRRLNAGGVYSVACTADGRVAAGCGDGTARVWDPDGGRPSAVLRGHAGPVTSVSFSPDGGRVATGSRDGTARVWDPASGKWQVKLTGHTRPVLSVAYSPDGHRVITGSQDATARVWDADTGRQLAVLRGYLDMVTSVAFSPDGRRVATGSGDRTVAVWDAGTGLELGRLGGYSGALWAVAFSADGRRVAAAGEDGTAQVWDLDAGEDRGVLAGHTSWVWSVGFSPDSRRAVTGSIDATVRIWDADTGLETATLPAGAEVCSVAYSPDGRRVVAGCGDGATRVWDAGTGRPHAVLRGHAAVVQSVAFSADGRLVTGSRDYTARIWTPDLGRTQFVLRGHTNYVWSATFSPDGRWVLTGAADGTARVWDAGTGRQLAVLRGHSGVVRSTVFSPDGRSAATGSVDGTVRVWDVPAWQERAVLKGNTGGVHALVYSPDGRRVVAGCGDGAARVWDADTGRQLAVLPGHAKQVLSTCFSPDGRWVATSSIDGTVRVRDGRFENEVGSLPRPPGAAAAAFGPDGRLLVRDATGVEVGALAPPRPAFPEITPPPAERAEGLVSPDGRFEARWGGAEIRLLARSLSTVGYDAGAEASAAYRARMPAWYAENAREAERAGHWFAAAFYRERLAALDPWDVDARAMAAYSWARAGRADRAAPYLIPGPGAVPGPGVAAPVSPLFGHGLRCEIYQGTGLSRLVATRVEKQLWWDGREGAPDPAAPDDLFSIRWTGSLTAPTPGRYTIAFWADDGVRLWIDDRLLIDAWSAPQRTTVRAEVELTGRPQKIRIEYFENRGWAGYRFGWVRPGGTTEELVPAECMSPFEPLHPAAAAAGPVTPPPGGEDDNPGPGVDARIVGLREAIRRNPDVAANYHSLGVSLEQKGDRAGAIGAYQQAVRLKINAPRTYTRLAFLLHDRGEYPAALQAMRTGLAVNPAWLTDPSTSYRYNLACLACLTAGLGKDSPGDPAALRREAFHWLTADLAFWRERAGGADTRGLVHQTMLEWLADSDFDSVRDGGDLPPAERPAWVRLWADVRALRDSTAPRETAPPPRPVTR